jgi:hypothetical protein
MNKQVGGGSLSAQNAIGGIVSNRPPTWGELNQVKLPEMNDRAGIEAQREILRQQELERSKQKSN